MPKTLGLNDDYWHGLIPFIMQVVLYPLDAYFLRDQVMCAVGIIYFALISLQFFNEWKQAVDPYVSLKYGSYLNFQVNSKRDTKFFIIGLLAGFFVGAILIGVVNYVFIH